jgi:hypothetical protein
MWDNATMAVLLELDHQMRSDPKKGNPRRFSSQRLAEIGVTHHTRQRGLRKLEKAGVIKIESRGARKSPLVTLLWLRLPD